MITPYIVTKIQIPSLRSEYVERPRLLQHLNAGLASKLILVSASTGFGKTTLISEWLHKCGRPVAWLALDEPDNDPLRFLTYLILAIQTVKSKFGDALLDNLQASKPGSFSLVSNDFLDALIQEINGIGNDLILTIDDYHVITNTDIQDFILYLLNNQPENMRTVISSRADPSLPLGRMRAMREMHEIRASDLRFTPLEATEFLNGRMGLSLTEQDVLTLENRTEGWIAGLQLAALSMQGKSNKQQFIENLAGSNRFISDYLVEEVLDKQSPTLQEFLLKTSILEKTKCRNLQRSFREG